MCNVYFFPTLFFVLRHSFTEPNMYTIRRTHTQNTQRENGPTETDKNVVHTPHQLRSLKTQLSQPASEPYTLTHRIADTLIHSHILYIAIYIHPYTLYSVQDMLWQIKSIKNS